MGWQWSVHALPMLLAPAMAVLVSVTISRSRSVGGDRRLLALVLAAAWWSMLYGLSLLQTGLAAKGLLHAVMYVGVTVTPVAWLLFVVDYTGGREWLTRRPVIALLVVPLITVVVAMTNEPVGVHELFWTDPRLVASGPLLTMQSGHGPWFWIHSAYSYTLVAASGLYLLRPALSTDRIHRVQAQALVVAVVIPAAANLGYLAGLTPSNLDWTGPALVCSGLILAVTIYRYQLLGVLPAARQLARSELVETTLDPVLVVGDGGDVLDLNPAATKLFGPTRSTAVGHPLDQLSPALADVVLDADATQTEIEIENGPDTRYFDVQVAPLTARYGVAAGRLLSLRDVTVRRRREQRLLVLNRLLRHDLRNVMTTIRGNAELVEHRVEDPTVRERMGVIERNVDTIVQRREKFDSVLRSLDVETVPIDAIEIAEELAAEARDQFPDVAVSFEAPRECWVDGHPIVRIALDELLENAVEHAATGVTVTVTTDDDVVRITVEDDGPGISSNEVEPLESGTETPLEHSSGVGLWTAKWIVEALDGSIGFETGDGTRVVVALSRVPSGQRGE